MKTTTPSNEVLAIANLCGGIEDIQTYLFGVLKEDYFGIVIAKEIFRRVTTLVKDGKGIPNISILLEDLALSEEARDFLQGYKKCKRLKKVDQAKQLVENLNTYRLLRICRTCSQKSLEILEKKKANVNEVIDLYEEAAFEARALSTSEELLHIGKDSNAEQIVKDILIGKAITFIPTGFEQFDRINGGFMRQGLIIIAATTSGGKSCMAVQLLINMYRQGHNVALVSLEMRHEEIISRILSNIARVDSMDILCNRFSDIEKKRMQAEWESFDRLGKENNCRYSIFTPERIVNIKDIFYSLARFKYDIIIIDYISLLDSAREDQPWKALGEIAKFTKNYIRYHDMVGVLLAQLNAENKIRYSGAIKEHADNVWSWVYDHEKAAETGHIITIDQQKARNQQKFYFKINEEFNYMTLTDYKEIMSEEEEKLPEKELDIEEDISEF